MADEDELVTLFLAGSTTRHSKLFLFAVLFEFAMIRRLLIRRVLLQIRICVEN